MIGNLVLAALLLSAAAAAPAASAQEPVEPTEHGGHPYTTTTALNLRAGPSTDHEVLEVMPAGATVLYYAGDVVDGFRPVVYEGTVGWAFDQFLTPADPGPPFYFATTVDLNLRTGPSTDHAVILVIPAGATVVDYDGETVNGFRSVDYQGTSGWAYDQFLVRPLE